MTNGQVYWVTGLFGAGKTTLCREMVFQFRARGRSVVMLDGDELREAMSATNTQTRQERLQLAMRLRICAT
jgi:adenylylsulfate kinase-like enzyme